MPFKLRVADFNFNFVGWISRYNPILFRQEINPKP